ncbi:hypothetical protein PoB_006657600 [Plakobranchus ocellatus]|uniref:Uncharacterized protein n=1 Tax=Plakobranchus ocellatus TaxID=259542 RepID=A0AAV4D7P8_9GAST|nr:hypothetical protein PoB_006657600 [Plakobranchus ocellatus]
MPITSMKHLYHNKRAVPTAPESILKTLRNVVRRKLKVTWFIKHQLMFRERILQNIVSQCGVCELTRHALQINARLDSGLYAKLPYFARR